MSSSVINLFLIHFKIKTITLKFKYRIFIQSLYSKDICIIYFIYTLRQPVPMRFYIYKWEIWVIGSMGIGIPCFVESTKFDNFF